MGDYENTFFTDRVEAMLRASNEIIVDGKTERLYTQEQCLNYIGGHLRYLLHSNSHWHSGLPSNFLPDGLMWKLRTGFCATTSAFTWRTTKTKSISSLFAWGSCITSPASKRSLKIPMQWIRKRWSYQDTRTRQFSRNVFRLALLLQTLTQIGSDSNGILPSQDLSLEKIEE